MQHGPKSSLHNQEGIGLLELMLSLAVIAMLLIMATRYYATAHMGEQVNTAAGIVQAMRGASAQWEAGQGSYSGISLAALNSFGLVPQDIWQSSTAQGATSNPWGGNVTVSSSNGSQLTISMSNIPGEACANLRAKIGNQVQSATCTSTASGTASTFTATTY